VTRKQLAQFAIAQALTIVALALGGYGYINYVDHRRVESERASQAQTRLIVCQIALGQADAFREASSPVGVQAREGWLALARQFRCE
jgi:hypothetical protein